MSGVIGFDPPISEAKAFRHPEVDGEYLVNIPGAIQIIKDADTPKGKRLYRIYRAEYHALSGQPLTHEKREELAFYAATKKVGWSFNPNVVKLD